MTVNEAIKLLAYGTAYEIKGAYSGKIYHKSYMNSSKNLDKYANMEVTDKPFYADFDRYKEDILHAESDELPDDDFRYGLRRAIEIIDKYKAESEDEE